MKNIKILPGRLRKNSGVFIESEAGYSMFEKMHCGRLLSIVIIEFPDVKSAQAFVDSDEYAPVKPIRLKNSECTLFIVDGV